jgi:arylformamidase
MSGDWIDVTVPLRDGMVHWPDDPAVRIGRHLALERGDPCNLTVVSMSVHSGTHMDAPLHFVSRGDAIDSMPLEAGVGPARVIGVRTRSAIDVAELRRHRIRRGERVLFRTRNSTRVWRTDRFIEDFVHFTTEAAAYLADRKARTIGIDYLSVAGFHDDTEATHRALLEAGVWIIEGLDLSKVPPGPYDMLCLPMKIAAGDGAPARVFLRPRARRATGAGRPTTAAGRRTRVSPGRRR